MSLGRSIVLATAILVGGSSASAQDLIVSRNVNLRVDPSTAQSAVRLMMPGSELFLLEQARTNNYYHVRTLDGLEGWAYAPRIAVMEPDPGTTPAPTPVGPEAFFNGCRPEGSALSAGDQARNVLKNRTTTPTPTDIDTAITLAAIFGPSDDESRFDNAEAATVIGFVHDVKAGGEETVNCAANTVAFKDTHIALTLSATDTLRSRRFVVEITPKWRAFVLAQGADWSTAGLRNAFEGRCVQVTGWMFFDRRHRHNAANTNPTGTQIHRATAWEIHPITAISEVPCT